MIGKNPSMLGQIEGQGMNQVLFRLLTRVSAKTKEYLGLEIFMKKVIDKNNYTI